MKELVQGFVESFDPRERNETASEKRVASFQINEPTKMKYDALQEKTNGRFGQKLKELLVEAIDGSYEKSQQD